MSHGKSNYANQALGMNLFSSDYTKRIFNNISWLALEKIIRMIASLIIGAWVARYLEPERFGYLVYLLSLLNIFQVISQLGLDNIAIRELSKNPNSHSELMGTIFLLRISSGAAGYLGVLFLVSVILPNDSEAFKLMSILALTIVIQSIDVIDFWFQSQLKSKLTALSKIFSLLVGNAIKILLIYVNADLIYFIITVLIEALALGVGLFISYNRILKRSHWIPNLCLAKELIKESKYYMLSGLALTIYLQFDKIIIFSLSGQSQLGVYTASQSIVNAFNFIPLIIASSFIPAITSTKNHYEMKVLFGRIFSMLWALSIILSILLFTTSELIIDKLYGVEFKDAQNILAIQSLVLLPVFLSVGNDYLSLSLKKGSFTLIKTLAGLLISIGLNLYLIPIYGIIGAVISSIAAHYFTNTVMYWIMIKESMQMHFYWLRFDLIRYGKNK